MSVLRPQRLWAPTIVLLPLALLTSLLVPAHSAAAGAVDLTIQLEVPPTATAASDFEVTMTIANSSEEDATDVSLTLEMDTGTTGITASQGPSVGASPAQLSVSGTVVTGTIASLPAKSSTKILITGAYPTSGSSAGFRAAVEVGPQDTEIDPSTNSVTQNTALDQAADITVTKTQDHASVATGQPRTYTLTYANNSAVNVTGLDVRDTYTYLIEDSSITYSVTCANSSTAPCPAWADGSSTTAAVNNYQVNLIDHRSIELPPYTSLTLSIPVTHTVACLTNGPVEGSNETAVSSEVVKLGSSITEAAAQGTLTGPACPDATILISKTQDRQSVESGQVRTYTLTYENTGTTDIKGLKIQDSYAYEIDGSTVSYTVSCAADNTAPCPAWANGNNRTLRGRSGSGEFITSELADIPAGKKLVLSVPVTHTISCLTGGSLEGRNRTSVTSSAYVLVHSTTDAGIEGTLTAMECPTAHLTVSKTQDKETVTAGETRTYTLTYANTGTTDIRGLVINDDYDYTIENSAVTYSIRCAPQSTADCPTWADGVTRRLSNSYGWAFLLRGKTIDLRAGQTLVLTMPFTHGITNGGCLAEGMKQGYNKTWVDSPTTDLGDSETVSRVDGWIRTTDVATTTSVSTSLPDPLQPMTVSTEISNGCGTATDVPVTITLPRQGLTVEDDAVPTCTSSGGGICPTDLVYDPASRTVTGTIPTLPLNGTVVIRLEAEAALTPAPTNSYSITTTAPDPWDLVPRTNTSSTTFALAGPRTDVTITHTVEGLPRSGAPETMEFPGTLQCSTSGDHAVTVSLPAGSAQGRISLTKKPLLGERCNLTITRPEAPRGFTWAESTPPGATESITRVNDPIVRSYTWRLQQDGFTAPDLPLTGGTGAHLFAVTGIGLVGLAGITAAGRRRARR